MQKRLNFVKQSTTTLKTKKNYENSQNESKTKIICLKNCSKCRRWSKTYEKKTILNKQLFSKSKRDFCVMSFFRRFQKWICQTYLTHVIYSLMIDCSTMIIKKTTKKTLHKLNRNKIFKLNKIINHFFKTCDDVLIVILIFFWSLREFWISFAEISQKKHNDIKKIKQKLLQYNENMTIHCFFQHNKKIAENNNKSQIILFDETL